MSATFSPDRRYRYALRRHWGDGRNYAAFIGLNPSTADETQDDPTIRRCISYAKAWECHGLIMVNLFAFRATDPRHMFLADDPIGPDNDITLRETTAGAHIIVAAWGVNGTFKNRDKTVRAMLPNLHYLRLTKDGHPAHPLYLPKSLTPQPWSNP